MEQKARAFEIQLVSDTAAAPNLQLTSVTQISKEEGKDSVSLWLDHPLNGSSYEFIGMMDTVQRSISFRSPHCSSQRLASYLDG